MNTTVFKMAFDAEAVVRESRMERARHLDEARRHAHGSSRSGFRLAGMPSRFSRHVLHILSGLRRTSHAHAGYTVPAISPDRID